MNYLPLFHHFKTIYQFPKHIIFLVKIVANASLINALYVFTIICSLKLFYHILILFLLFFIKQNGQVANSPFGFNAQNKVLGQPASTVGFNSSSMAALITTSNMPTNNLVSVSI